MAYVMWNAHEKRMINYRHHLKWNISSVVLRVRFTLALVAITCSPHDDSVKLS